MKIASEEFFGVTDLKVKVKTTGTQANYHDCKTFLIFDASDWGNLNVYVMDGKDQFRKREGAKIVSIMMEGNVELEHMIEALWFAHKELCRLTEQPNYGSLRVKWWNFKFWLKYDLPEKVVRNVKKKLHLIKDDDIPI